MSRSHLEVWQLFSRATRATITSFACAKSIPVLIKFRLSDWRLALELSDLGDQVHDPIALEFSQIRVSFERVVKQSKGAKKQAFVDEGLQLHVLRD